jgi:hypothetical protein
MSIDSLATEKIKIKVDNYDSGSFSLWKIDKFSDRYYILKDKVDHFFATNQIVVDTQKTDPFWDPPQHIEAGIAYIMIKPIAYLFDIEKCLSVYGAETKIGSINVNFVLNNWTIG